MKPLEKQKYGTLYGMDNELKERAEKFLAEYGELVIKHKMDFASYPTWIPNANGYFTVGIQSTPVDVTETLAKANNLTPDAQETEKPTDPK